MNFDEIIDRRGTDCAKWDKMEEYYGVSPDDGLAMWVADTDFRAPDVVLNRMREMVDHGIFGQAQRPALANEQPLGDACRVAL